MQEPIVRTPMYYESSGYAKDHNELDMFRNSHWANCACKDEIESAISRNFDGMHLQKECVTEVLDRYGTERVSVILAATVQVKAWDGRFSSSNKDWAFNVRTPNPTTPTGWDRRNDYAVNTHPAIFCKTGLSKTFFACMPVRFRARRQCPGYTAMQGNPRLRLKEKKHSADGGNVLSDTL